ncbi:7TM diverse intracellular signaling domain-containing protein [Lutibacter sp.]
MNLIFSKNISKILFYLFLLIFSFSFSQNKISENINLSIAEFKDLSGSKSLEQILDGNFIKTTKNTINFNLISSNLWVKITVQKKETTAQNEWKLILKGPLTDSIIFYNYQNKQWNSKVYGFKVPKNKASEQFVNTVIPISLKDTLEHTYYLKIKSRIATDIPVELKSEKTFYSENNIDLLSMGILYGILLTFIVYNFLLYFILKNLSYLYFSLSTFATLLVQGFLNGHAPFYLFPNNPNISFYLFFISIYLGVFFVTLFSISILGLTKESGKWNYYLLKYISYFSLILIPTIFIFDFYVFSVIIIILVSIYTIALFSTGIIYWFKGNKIAKIFTIAWVIYLLGIFSNFLRSLDLIPINWFTIKITFLSYLGEIILFSIALGYHYKMTKQEKKILQKEYTKKLNIEVEQKTMELSTALKHKNELLAEIHHRVKNNLQIIYSLFNLQERRIKNPESKDILESGKNKVKSMSLVHEHLYKNDSFKDINIKNYLTDLVSYLNNLYKKEVLIDTKITPLNVPNDQAVTIGLIATEVLSNSFKYAFTNKVLDPKITISFYSKNNYYCLEITDNGIGFDSTTQQKNSLGIQLIKGMTQQLNGEITLNSTKGTSYKFVLPFIK